MTVRRSDPKAPSASPSKPLAPAKPERSAAPRNAVRTSEDGSGRGQAPLDHTETLDIVRDAKVSPAAQGGKRVADAVMACIGSYDRAFLLDTDGLKAHVQQVATRFIAAADAAQEKGSVYNQLKAKFPGAQISLTGTGSLQAQDQLVYLVRAKDHSVRKFVDAGGKALESPGASDAIFMAADLSPGKHMAVRVPEVRFLISPTLPPQYGVGRQVAVVVDQDLAAIKKNAGDKVSSEFSHVYRETLPGTQKGEDGKPLAVVYSDKREEKGKIVKYNGDRTFDVEVTQPDGTKKIVKQSEDQIRSANDPMVYNLHGAHFDDVLINVDQDPKLAEFLQKAKAVAEKDIPKTGTPAQIAAGQKQALIDLTVLCNSVLSYPDENANTTDAGSKQYMQLENAHSNWNPMKLGDLIACGRGVCRHQAILMQLACQTAGIASRTVSATANDKTGNFRGYHAFLETTLDDGSQFLTDPTWFDAGPVNVKGYTGASPVVNGQRQVGTQLWDTLYFNLERQVLPTWQDNARDEDHKSIGFNESNTPVVNDPGNVPGPMPTPVPTPTPTPTPSIDAKAVLATVTSHLKKIRTSDPVGADLKAHGDKYMAAHHPAQAAKEYAKVIAAGTDTSKTIWLKLADALSQAGMTADADQARAVANSLS